MLEVCKCQKKAQHILKPSQDYNNLVLEVVHDTEKQQVSQQPKTQQQQQIQQKQQQMQQPAKQQQKEVQQQQQQPPQKQHQHVEKSAINDKKDKMPDAPKQTGVNKKPTLNSYEIRVTSSGATFHVAKLCKEKSEAFKQILYGNTTIKKDSITRIDPNKVKDTVLLSLDKTKNVDFMREMEEIGEKNFVTQSVRVTITGPSPNSYVLKNIPLEMTESDIKKTIVDKNNLKVTTVKRLGQTKTIKFNVIGKKPSNVVYIEVKGQTDKLHNRRVHEYKPNTTCFRCGETDHFAKHCKAKKEVCPICCEAHSIKEHKQQKLTKIFCKKCNSSTHPLLKCKREHSEEPVGSMSPNQEEEMEITETSQKPNNKAADTTDNENAVLGTNANVTEEQTPTLGSLQKQINTILEILRKSEPKSNI